MEGKCGNVGSRLEKFLGKNAQALVQLLLWYGWQGQRRLKRHMLCLLMISIPEITAKRAVLSSAASALIPCILRGSSWFRTRLWILSLSTHKLFMNPSPFNRCLLYVLREVSPWLLSFCWHLYHILLICMWCSIDMLLIWQSEKDSNNVSVLQRTERRVLGSPEKFLCRVNRRKEGASSWQGM